MLDTACARLALGQNATSRRDRRRARAQLDDLRGADARSRARSGAGRRSRRAAGGDRATRRTQTEARWPSLKARWEKERDLVSKIREIRGKLEAGMPRAAAAAAGAAAGAARRSRPPTTAKRCAPNWPQLNAELDSCRARRR